MKIKPIAMGARGFTLVELIIVVGIFGGVSAAAYAMYSVQQRSYFLQEQLVEMQQNIRAFEFFLEKDVRMAGYDVYKEGQAGFLIAKPGEIAFTADLGRPRGRRIARAQAATLCPTVTLFHLPAQTAWLKPYAMPSKTTPTSMAFPMM